MSSFPLVSIGLPVYNGENYLREAIEAALNQTYQNLQLVISDNGSTDDTAKICEEYQKKDNRIIYHRYDQNLGACKNYNNTFELAEGKYFKWLAHDDLIEMTYLEKTVAVLEADEDIVLCASAKMDVDANGNDLDLHSYEELNLQQEEPLLRYRLFLDYFKHSFANADLIMGLMRSNVLRHTRLIGNYTSSDFTLLGELILRGKFHILPEPLFKRRIHHGISTSVHNADPQAALKIDPDQKIQHRNHVQIAKWFDPNGKARRIPHFKWLSELISSIRSNSFGAQENFQLHLLSYRWFLTKASKSVKDKLSKVLSNQ